MMLEMGLHHPFRDPVFEPILLEEETTWRYRGQVIPSNKLISLDLDILEINDKGDTLFAHDNLWVDFLKIYNLPRVGMRIKEAPDLLSEKSRLSAGSWMKSRAIQSGLEDGLLLDMTGAFLDEFVEDLIFEDVGDFYSISGPAIYMANHQTAVESYLALAVIYGLKGGRLSAISKQENKELWIGKLLELGKHLLRDMPLDIIYFNRDKPEEFITIYKNYLNSARENNHSLLVHVSGTREMVEGALLERMSSVLIDIALEYDLPIVPLRFTNGLPPESHSKRWDFPFNNQKQTYIFGKQLNLKEMKTLRPTERTMIFLNQSNRMITQKSDNKFFAPPKSHKNPVLSPNIATLSPFGKVLLNLLLKFSNLSNEGHLFLEYCSGKSVQSQLESKFQHILGVIQQ